MSNKGIAIIGAGIVGIGIIFYLVTRKTTGVLNPPDSFGDAEPVENKKVAYVDTIKRIKAGQLAEPTKVTYNQNLLNQPLELEGVTWMKGIVPQDRPDKYWEDVGEVEGEQPTEKEVKKKSVKEPYEYSDAIMHTANLVPIIPITPKDAEITTAYVTNLASDESGAYYGLFGVQH